MKKENQKLSAEYSSNQACDQATVIAIDVEHFKTFFGTPGKPEERSFTGVTETVQADVKWLIERINTGDADALKTLVEMSIYTASVISMVVSANPGLARKVAAKRSEWPIIITQNPKYPVDADELRSLLQLESESPRPFRLDLTKVLDPASVPHMLVYNALVALDELRKQKGPYRLLQEAKRTLLKLESDNAEGSEVKTHILKGLIKDAESRWEAARTGMARSLVCLDQALKIDSTAPPVDLAELAELGCHLQQRNPQNGKQWFKAACDLILLVAGGIHGGNRVLASEGASGKLKFKKRLLKEMSLKDADEIIRSGRRKKTENNYVWAETERKLKRAFNAMSPKFPPTPPAG